MEMVIPLMVLVTFLLMPSFQHLVTHILMTVKDGHIKLFKVNIYSHCLMSNVTTCPLSALFLSPIPICASYVYLPIVVTCSMWSLLASPKGDLIEPF